MADIKVRVPYFEIHTEGPFFDGRAVKEVNRFLEDAKDIVADKGANDARAATIVFKNPTGYYMSRIDTDRQINDRTVNDSGVIYGPWLEGTSSRNRSSRFKGYSIFRKVAQRLQDRVPMLVAESLAAHIRRMN